MKNRIFLLLAVLLLALTGCEKEPEEIDTTLYTNFTDALEMDFTYEGKDFIADGVGVVTLDRCTDGDTAQFTNGSVKFSVRFLGIDTPESTYRIDPWGKSASAYTCDKLENATEIVLESDGARMDGNGRYLAWVWYDGRLLNLELIEQAFSNARGTTDTKYEDVVYDAELKTQPTQRRIWGELDPNYDYSLEGTQISIEELVTNSALYETSKIVVTGIVVAEIEGHPYIYQDGYGIYLYLGFENSVKVAVGNEIRIEGLNLTYYPDKETGSPQLTGFKKRNIELISEGNVVDPRVTEVADLTTDDLGSYLSISGLEVVSIFTSNNTGDHTITVKDATGNEMGLHITKSVSVEDIESMFVIGSIIDATGPLSRYMGQYQFELNSLELIIKK